jgi:F-type H+-transporting ATPase subunit b
MLAVLTPLASSESGGSSFLVSPNVGLMIWTLLAFGVTLVVLNKFAFPAIRDALDKRVKMIDDSIEDAKKAREESDALLAEYRERLKDARVQADEIVARARKAAETHEHDSSEEARVKRAEMLEQTRRDIDAETRRAIEEIRSEVANLTVLATEKVTGRVLTDADQQRLVDEALGELDFSAISGERRN